MIRALSISLAALTLLSACEKQAPAPAPEASAEPAVAPPASGPEPEAKSEPISLFNGVDLSGWVYGEDRTSRRFWTVGQASINADDPERTLTVSEGGDQLITPKIVGADLHSEQRFGDFLLTFEFMLPPKGNSGVYLLGQYELQIEHDPEADPANPTDMNVGSVPRMLAPKMLAPITPGHWHTYEIDFRAPRFDAAGNKTENAKLVRVVIDGIVVQENAEIPGATVGALIDKADLARGPIVLQGSHTPVAFRDIVLTPR